jgi:SagB-type dehydrogenase family enzyme
VREAMAAVASSAAAGGLADLWREARLRADAAKSTSVRPTSCPAPWRAVLEEVLGVAYGQQTQCRFVDGAWQQVRWRTTPSAGALYPYEVMACVIGEGTYLWDVQTGRLRACEATPLTDDQLREARLVSTTDARVEAVLVVIARPWLSMKKYRQRGYPYCHLDIGHVTANIALYATSLGYPPTLHLRFSRSRIAEQLRLGGLCREPVAVLSFANAGRTGSPAPSVEIETGADQAPGLEAPEPNEMRNWESLRGVLSFDAVIDRPGPPTRVRLVEEPAIADAEPCLPLPDGASPPATAVECRSAILSRRSAKGFQDRPLALGQVGALLGALRGESVQEDCAWRDSSLGVRLIAANVEGLTGVFAYAPSRHALVRLDATVDDVRSACMFQRTAGGAAVLLVFHAPARRLLEGYSSFAEFHCHAAQLGQRLHLAATRLSGVGMTCLGGFDGERCAALARLETGEEAVYVILLGVPDESAVKYDRLSVAFSHGYATEEG